MSATYAKLYDSFYAHPKVTALEEGPCFAESIAIWTLALSWCSAQNNGGLMPLASLRKLVPFDPKPACDELVRVALFVRERNALRFHDWDTRQASLHRVEKKKAGGKVRSKRHRDKVKAERDALRNVAVTRDVTRDVRSDVRDRDANSKREREESLTDSPNLTLPTKPAEKATNRVTDAFAASFAGTEREAWVASEFSRHREAAGHGKFMWDKRPYGPPFEALQRIAAYLADEGDPGTAIADATRGFLGDERARTAGYPIGFLAADVGRYVAQGRKQTPKGEDAEVLRLKGEYREAASGSEDAVRRGDRNEAVRLRENADRLAGQISKLSKAVTA